MSDATVDQTEQNAKKSSKLPLIIGLVLAVAGGGGGFYAVQSGLLGPGNNDAATSHPPADPGDPHVATMALPDVSFVEVPPVLISLGPGAQASHLRFRASLEVPTQYQAEVEKILPRIQDVLNSYLRALEAHDLEAQGALVRLRGQLLRRIKLVAGEERVRDLLVLEFVLN